MDGKNRKNYVSDILFKMHACIQIFVRSRDRGFRLIEHGIATGPGPKHTILFLVLAQCCLNSQRQARFLGKGFKFLFRIRVFDELFRLQGVVLRVYYPSGRCLQRLRL